MNIAKAILILLFTYASVGFGKEAVENKAVKKCMDKSSGTQEMIVCVENEIINQNNIMSVRYKKISKELTQEKKKQFDSIHKSWQQYSKASCDFYLDQLPQALDSKLFAKDCILTKLQSRNQELLDLLTK